MVKQAFLKYRILALGLLGFTCISGFQMSEEVTVTDVSKELLAEFIFPCSPANNWIMDPPNDECVESYTYLMLFTQEGKILEHKDGIWKAERENLMTPNKNSSDNGFLLRFVWNRDAVKIITSDMKVLTVTNDGQLKMVDIHSKCPSKTIDSEDLSILQLACESRGECSSSSNAGDDAEPTDTILAKGCLDGRWKLVKKGIFLEIQVDNNQEEKLAIKDGTPVIHRRGESFTGKDTNFRTGYYLDNSNKKSSKPFDGIKDDAYGDIVITYYDRNGEHREAFVCNYMWDEVDSGTICSELNYTSSMPTFDGSFSVKKTDFGISGVACSKYDSRSFTNCPFTVEQNNDGKIKQQTMKAFGGKGYSCSMTNYRRDIGGVVCGSPSQIRGLLNDKIMCDRDLQATKSLGQVFSLEQQVRKYKDEIRTTASKHWSEFLLPIPLSVTLLAAVMLTSTTVRPITLEKPEKGFEYLEYSSLEGNLLLISSSITESFFVSNSEMGSVKMEAKNIEKSLLKIVKYLTKNVKMVKRYLKKMVKSVQETVKHVDTIIHSFNNTEKKIGELLKVLGHTNSITDEQRKTIKTFLEIKEKEAKVNKRKLEEQRKKKEQQEIKTKKAQKAVFDKSEKLLKQQCINNGTTVCENCKHRGNMMQYDENNKTICSVDTVERCDEYGDKIDKCLFFEEKCEDWQAIAYHSECSKWVKDKCKEYSYKRDCIRMDKNFCPKPLIKPAGFYCFDKEKFSDDMCGKCNHIEVVVNDLKTISKFATTILHDSKNERIKRSNDFIKKNIGNIDDLSTKLDQYLDKLENSDEKDQNETKSTLDNLIEVRITYVRASKQMFEIDSKDDKDLLQFCVAFLEQLESMKDVMKDSDNADFLQRVKDLSTKVKRFREDKQKILDELKENTKKNPTDFSYGSLANEAIDYQENLEKRAKLERDVESLTNIMMESIKTILTKKVEKDDLDSVIAYLRETSDQLTHISKLWLDMRLFFSFIANVVKSTKTASDDVTELSNDLIDIDDMEFDEDTLNEIRESTIEALAYNSYIYRISKFYNNLMDGPGSGLLVQLKLVNNERNKFRGNNADTKALNLYKKTLEAQAVATQQKIIEDIMHEEQIIRDDLTENIRNIENEFACALKDTVSEKDTESLIASISKIRARENISNIKD